MEVGSSETRSPARAGATSSPGGSPCGPSSSTRPTRSDSEKTLLETTRNLNGDLLLSYLVNPWTALFVGYNGNYQNLELVEGTPDPTLIRTSGDFLNDSRQFFLKLSYLFRP